MNYVFKCTITAVFERLVQKYVSGFGKESVFSTASVGWYVQIDGLTSVYIGVDQPAWKVGDQIELILRKP